MFDYFANCEYFEDEFDYDDSIKLPKIVAEDKGEAGGVTDGKTPPYTYLGQDNVASIRSETIGLRGMKVDRMFFEKFEDRVREDDNIVNYVNNGEWENVIEYVNAHLLLNPEEPYSIEKLRRAADVDRRISVREILEKVFGLIPRFKSKDELLEEEFAKFIAEKKPEDVQSLPAMKQFFKAYATSDAFRAIINTRDLGKLVTNPGFTTRDYREVPTAFRTMIPEYIKDYVSLNRFAP